MSLSVRYMRIFIEIFTWTWHDWTYTRISRGIACGRIIVTVKDNTCITMNCYPTQGFSTPFSSTRYLWKSQPFLKLEWYTGMHIASESGNNGLTPKLAVMKFASYTLFLLVFKNQTSLPWMPPYVHGQEDFIKCVGKLVALAFSRLCNSIQCSGHWLHFVVVDVHWHISVTIWLVSMGCCTLCDGKLSVQVGSNHLLPLEPTKFKANNMIFFTVVTFS